MTQYFSADVLRSFMSEAFYRLGVPKEDAELCADVLVEADLRGITSHGCNRFKPIYVDRIEAGIQMPVTNAELVKDSPAVCVIDAHNGMGMVVAHQCMDMAMDKAKRFGIGMVVARNSTHYGIAGYYATMATNAGLIGITGTNARPSVAPTFGVEPMLGTNPLTVGFPTDEPFPFVLDCATSTTQRGKIEYYARMGEATKSGMVIDQQGVYITSSGQILDLLTKGLAAFAPLGGIGEAGAGYKGYGYSVVVEVLSAALSMGSFMTMLTGRNDSGERRPYHLGHFFIAIDPNAFMGLNVFKKTTGDILRALRASKKTPGTARIYTAGEKEFLKREEQLKTGIAIDDGIVEELNRVAHKLKMAAIV